MGRPRQPKSPEDSGIEESGARELFETNIPGRLVIRTCVESDLALLEWYGLFAHHRELIRDTFEKQARGDALMLVLEWNGYPAGQVWIDFDTRRDVLTAVLWALRVVPWLQNLGMGTKLLQVAEQEIARRGYIWSELGVEIGGSDLRAYYEKRGYRFTGQIAQAGAFRDAQGLLVSAGSPQWMLVKRAASPAGQSH
jgi:GNAT superfamily N-acetyltransferase